MRPSCRVVALVIVLVLIATQSSTRASAATEDRAQDPGQATFKSSCSSCHGSDGAGHTPTGKALQIPDLRSAAQKLTDEEIAEIINKGKTGRMPGFGTKLGNEQVEVLVKYIRKLGQDSKASNGK